MELIYYAIYEGGSMGKTKVMKDEFYSSMIRLVIPIVLQNLISTAVNSADVVIVGLIGQDALSSVSLANQLQFILNLVYCGIASGATIMAAQYWGKQDTDAIEKIMGIAMRFSIGVSALFAVLDRKSTRLNSSHIATSRMPSSAWMQHV